MTEIPDLWPKQIVETESSITPFTILKQQAATLAGKTEGLIEGAVSRRTDDEGDFWYSFRLVAPTLNYSYELFAVWHEPVALYPVHCSFLNQKIECTTEAEFIEWLKIVFSSTETKRVINGLLIQAREQVTW
ncbi:MAG: hypothetical protein DMG65_16480 [Candidatus Angelobacter sp. Gp1-AA117]|nr:MAG: hypothetical protein DMG65_16480 [Candidatus Angelobacter sp. Gp1-AA117]